MGDCLAIKLLVNQPSKYVALPQSAVLCSKMESAGTVYESVDLASQNSEIVHTETNSR